MLNKFTQFRTIEAKVMFGVLMLILVLVNGLVISKEHLLANGELVLLELAPRDPRSILQGDYMALRYRIANQISSSSDTLTEDGYVVVALDDNNVASFIDIYESGSPLGSNERLLQYRKRNGIVNIAANAYFFQERHGKYYSTARYGEVRASDAGDSVLTGLRDAEFRKLKPEENR